MLNSHNVVTINQHALIFTESLLLIVPKRYMYMYLDTVIWSGIDQLHNFHDYYNFVQPKFYWQKAYDAKICSTRLQESTH